MSDKKQLFVERRPQGDYAVRRGGSDRASDVLRRSARRSTVPAILRRGHDPLVERVRYTNGRTA